MIVVTAVHDGHMPKQMFVYTACIDPFLALVHFCVSATLTKTRIQGNICHHYDCVLQDLRKTILPLASPIASSPAAQI